MPKKRERRTKNASMGKSVAFGFAAAAIIAVGVIMIGAGLIAGGKLGAGEMESVGIAAVFCGAFAGSLCCSKMGGKFKGGLIVAAGIVALRLITGAFSENDLLGSCTLSTVLAAALGGVMGSMLGKGGLRRRRV